MALQQVPEGTTAYIQASFYDKDGNLAAPSTINYTVHDEESGTEVRALTPIGAASVVEIELDKTDNDIVDNTNEYETRVVTIIASYGGNDQLADEYKYIVKNLNFLA